MTFWYSSVAAQEYLPPKNGKKPAAAEPTQPANYNYSYDVQDNTITLDFGHNEKRKDDRTTGSYHVLLPDGRMQLVEYEAGPNGYKPVIMYMGTATYPAANNDKFDGYHYNAASNRQSVRQAAPRSRQPPPAPLAPAPSAVTTVTHPPPSKPSNSTKNSTK
ncbi:unnamed protein product [Plutella xylostella]|uniref:(diamondback moth) hypothetical protein n=1 Tax=Plutella xylostella TaxID=51655 RepID=A0A8S4ECE0_PLUXY|nr:unnamed protein product [Plutella xylostella]